MNDLKITPVVIDGVNYYTVKDFAALRSRTTGTIYSLIKKGNTIRKLKARYVVGRPLIPESELTDFPWTPPGPNSEERSYYYDEEENAE